MTGVTVVGVHGHLVAVEPSLGCLLGDLQPEQNLVAVKISGSFETVSLVKRDRAALALPGSRPHRVDAPFPEVLDD
jgi:hypothetical protein